MSLDQILHRLLKAGAQICEDFVLLRLEIDFLVGTFLTGFFLLSPSDSLVCYLESYLGGLGRFRIFLHNGMCLFAVSK